MSSRDTEYMRRALDLARRGVWSAHPNPRVGAVVVNNGEVVGEGWHRGPGTDHAEVAALDEAGERSRGGTLYVNLEPCSHLGRTPPCTDAILERGIARVVYAVEDPDRAVSGNGDRLLRDAGITVDSGVLAPEALELNEGYMIHRMLGRPRVTYKAAVTLDGRTADQAGNSRWISCEESRRQVQFLRAESDAIAVGAGTVLADDPELTCRLTDYDGSPPVRVVFDARGVVREGARILDSSAPTWIITTSVGAEQLKSYHGDTLETVVVDCDERGVNLEQALDELGGRGIVDLLVEGGAQLAGSLIDENLIDRCILFIAPLALGGNEGRPLFEGIVTRSLEAAFEFDFRSVVRSGDDLMVIGVPRFRSVARDDRALGAEGTTITGQV